MTTTPADRKRPSEQAEAASVARPEAEKTGQFVVAVYEASGHLLAVHGPYDNASAARDAAEQAQKRDRAEVYSLWHPEHVGRD